MPQAVLMWSHTRAHGTSGWPYYMEFGLHLRAVRQVRRARASSRAILACRALKSSHISSACVHHGLAVRSTRAGWVQMRACECAERGGAYPLHVEPICSSRPSTGRWRVTVGVVSSQPRLVSPYLGRDVARGEACPPGSGHPRAPSRHPPGRGASSICG